MKKGEMNIKQAIIAIAICFIVGLAIGGIIRFFDFEIRDAIAFDAILFGFVALIGITVYSKLEKKK